MLSFKLLAEFVHPGLDFAIGCVRIFQDAVVIVHQDAARGPLPSGMWRKRRPKLIDIAIVLVQTMTIACRNIFDSPLASLYIKTAARAHQDSPNMHAFRLQMRRDHGFDQISCSEAAYPAWPLRFAARESLLVNVDHLTRLWTSGLDQPGAHPL